MAGAGFFVVLGTGTSSSESSGTICTSSSSSPSTRKSSSDVLRRTLFFLTIFGAFSSGSSSSSRSMDGRGRFVRRLADTAAVGLEGLSPASELAVENPSRSRSSSLSNSDLRFNRLCARQPQYKGTVDARTRRGLSSSSIIASTSIGSLEGGVTSSPPPASENALDEARLATLLDIGSRFCWTGVVNATGAGFFGAAAGDDDDWSGFFPRNPKRVFCFSCGPFFESCAVDFGAILLMVVEEEMERVRGRVSELTRITRSNTAKLRSSLPSSSTPPRTQ